MQIMSLMTALPGAAAQGLHTSGDMPYAFHN